MNYELFSLALLYISAFMFTLSVFIMFLFINSCTNELRDRVIHILISASFSGILLSYALMLALDFMERLP